MAASSVERRVHYLAARMAPWMVVLMAAARDKQWAVYSAVRKGVSRAAQKVDKKAGEMASQ